MTIPSPVFMPADSSAIDNAVIQDKYIRKFIEKERADERRTRADGFASRLRFLSMIVIREKLDYSAIAQLLESEASEMERQIQEWNHA